MIKMLAFFVALGMGVVILNAFFNGAQGGIATQLTAILLNTETDAAGVSTTAGFKSAGKVYINNEIIRYTGIDAPGSCPSPIPALSGCFTGLTRGIGEVDASTHAIGSRVYDEVLGIANLGAQQSYSVLSTENESGTTLTKDPRTWISFAANVTQSMQPTFLTGNWAYVNVIFGFFAVIFTVLFGMILIALATGRRLF